MAEPGLTEPVGSRRSLCAYCLHHHIHQTNNIQEPLSTKAENKYFQWFVYNTLFWQHSRLNMPPHPPPKKKMSKI